MGMEPAVPSDQALVARLSARDSSALDELYQRYVRAVYSLACRVLGDPSLAEDVVQDVFLKLWRQPESYRAERGSLGPWLLSVTHNRSVDMLRRRRSHAEQQFPEVQEAPATVINGALDPVDLAGLQEDAAAIRRALARIPPEQRRAIEMAFFEGKTHVEISAELGEPLGTAKTRIRLGMRKLRALLEAEGVVLHA